MEVHLRTGFSQQDFLNRGSRGRLALLSAEKSAEISQHFGLSGAFRPVMVCLIVDARELDVFTYILARFRRGRRFPF